MRILAIETSCDETAIAIIEASGGETSPSFAVLGNALLSQIEAHRQYGGVFPALAKREHAKNLVPVLDAALEEARLAKAPAKRAGLLRESAQALSSELRDKISEILSRESVLAEQFFEFIAECEPPAIDAIAVTAGPGLEPALWVGINFAKALALVWGKPLVAVNHMEGHILAALAQPEARSAKHQEPNKFEAPIFEITNAEMPVLALLISGGHTELVLMKKRLQYEMVGQTRDDAVGEAFDKVARLLGLPYPGGPEISRLAEECRTSDVLHSKIGHPMSDFKLPRPMLHDDTCDFSFSGLKTAVRYLLEGRNELSPTERQHLAREFEDAVTEVLWKKTVRALEATGAKTLVIGGGVSANTHIRRVFTQNVDTKCPQVELRIPTAALTTDNALMIAMAGYYHALQNDFADPDLLKANGNLTLAAKT